MPYVDIERRRAFDRAYYRAHAERYAEQARIRRAEHADEIKAAKRAYYLAHREAILARTAEQRAAYRASDRGRVVQRLNSVKRRSDPVERQRMRARAAVNNAIASGRLVAQPCRSCGAAKAEAHHPFGYSEEAWLAVWWLCRTCHAAVHVRQ
jgi:hypothetical protein